MQGKIQMNGFRHQAQRRADRSRLPRVGLSIFAALAVVLPALAVARAFNDYRTLLVGRDGFGPSISLDGSTVAFVSAGRGRQDVYSRALNSRHAVLVSRANGNRGSAAHANATSPASSGSGRIVAFVSSAGNLGGRAGVENVYLREISKGRTILVSRASGRGGAKGNGNSFAPAISTNGKKIVFASAATNLVPGAGRVVNIYLRDLTNNRTTLISRASGAGGAPADADSAEPAISSTGNAVAFASAADNLGIAVGGATQVFERSLRSNTTFLVSRAPGADGAQANADSGDPSLDGDGGKVAFDTRATNLGDGAKPVQNVYLRDMGSGATTLISRSGGRKGAPGDRDSSLPDLPRDGRFVCFQSMATNLGNVYDGFAEDTTVSNVYVHDTLHSGTFLISRITGRYSPGANGQSSNVSCSAGASLAAFQSSATNLKRSSGGAMSVFRRTIFGGR